MDSVDKRLLAALRENPRRSMREIASAAGVSREVADYRVKKLDGVIRGYRAKIKNYDSSCLVLLRFKTSITNHVLSCLRKYPHWMARASGWDVLCFLSSSDIKKEITRFFDSVGGEVKKSLVLPVLKEKEVRPKTDLKDEKILKILSRNAKSSNREIAKKIGVTPEAARRRIDRLEEKGVIEGYKTLFYKEKLGIKTHFVFLELPFVDSTTQKKALSIGEHYLTTGKYNMVVKHDGDLDEILPFAKKNFEVSNIETLSVS